MIFRVYILGRMRVMSVLLIQLDVGDLKASIDCRSIFARAAWRQSGVNGEVVIWKVRIPFPRALFSTRIYLSGVLYMV